MRDGLWCQKCGKRNLAAYWPEGGDSVPFFYQSSERTEESPGAYRLPVACPYCKEWWFVVWDEAPDLLSGQFLRHIERMCQEHAANEDAVGVWRSLISDAILGEHLKFLRSKGEAFIDHRQMVQHSFKEGDFYCTLTAVPASEPGEIRARLGGSYSQYMNGVLADAEIDRLHTVHWVLALGGEHAMLHMLFIPRKDRMADLPSLLPLDLLTWEERSQLGL